MKYGLNILENGSLDFLSLGALVHRLDPGLIPFRKANHCDIHVSGGEFNVAANLADCFQLRTGIASAMSSYPIGDLIAERVRAMGVKPFYKHFKHDGVHGPNMATVYSDRGQGVRAPVVFYNRCNEAAAQLKPGDFVVPDQFIDRTAPRRHTTFFTDGNSPSGAPSGIVPRNTPTSSMNRTITATSPGCRAVCTNPFSFTVAMSFAPLS